MAILDSGERRKFESGAVRDVQEGKGRCDLLPLDVIAPLLHEKIGIDEVVGNISIYIEDGDISNLFLALKAFIKGRYTNMPTAILEVAKHYSDGCQKYGERNWEKGINSHCYIDSGVRHYLKCLRGDTDEPHDRAFIWNMLGAIWTHKHRPECIDLPFANKENTDG
jgi:hypothetical protein